MPGSPLDLEYPVTGDSVYDVLRKFSDNFQTLETDLEAKVSESDILVGGPLSVRDNPIQDVGQVVMSPQVVAPTAEGTLSYANGYWYVADAVGAIRLTDGSGGFNSSGFKGIGGDYGAGDPSEVTYSASAGLYEFTDDPGVYSDGAFEAVKFMRAAGSIAVSAPSGVTGALTLTLPEPPASGTSMLTLTSAGVLEADAAVTNAQTFAAITATTVTAGSLLRTTAKTQAISLPTALLLSTTGLGFTSGVWRTSGANSGINCGIPLVFGEKLSAVTVETKRVSAGTTVATLYCRNADYSVTSVVSASSAVVGSPTLTLTVPSPATLPVGVFYYVIVTPDSASDTDIRNINYTSTIEA